MIVQRIAGWFITGVLLILSCGCAALAKEPPTPAKDLDVRHLLQPIPGEKYFVTLFAWQGIPKAGRNTHVWASVVRMIDRGNGNPPQVETATISWLPANLKIRQWSMHVEPGTNLGLQATLDLAVSKAVKISQWGPYECRPSLHERFLVQKGFLESGKVGYQCIDDMGEAARKGNGCNCIHALTDMDPIFNRAQYPLTRYGNSAAEHVVEQIWERGILFDPDETHPEINQYLGTLNYPIHQRKYRGPVGIFGFHIGPRITPLLRRFPISENEKI